MRIRMRECQCLPGREGTGHGRLRRRGNLAWTTLGALSTRAPDWVTARRAMRLQVRWEGDAIRTVADSIVAVISACIPVWIVS